jgi:dolichol-phosphate mannosyltransferase
VNKELSLIVPTYNEVDNIQELIERLASSLKGFDSEVIFVDDGSPDGTAEAISVYGRFYDGVKVSKRSARRGLSSAVMHGLRIAEGDVVAVIDGDLQHPPELLPQMLAEIRQGFDLVVASRYVKDGNSSFSSSIRKSMSKIAVNLAHLLLPKTRIVGDPVSGYFMMRKRILRDIKFTLKGNKILLEIIAQHNGNLIAELPYTFAVRKKGESKLGLVELINYLHLIIKLRIITSLA